MQLFFATDLRDGFAFFDEEESRHLLTVLRFKVGDALTLTDGKGFLYDAQLSEAGKRQAIARIERQRPAPEDLRPPLHMAVAPPKNLDRFEWFLEKAVEIGVDVVTPLLCDRSERTALRVDRLEKIAVSAMKQSYRARLPRIEPLTPFAHFVQACTTARKFLPWIAPHPQPLLLEALLQGAGSVAIAIGPEGDFSPAEITLAQQSGFQGISLGNARLRTETAAILGVAAVQLAGVS